MDAVGRAPIGANVTMRPAHALARACATATATVAAAAGAALAAARALGARLVAELRGGFRAQIVASIGLAPLTLVAFQQVSLVGLVSNLVAEPWVTLVVTPLTLLGVALPPLWHVAAFALRPLLSFLAWLARWPVFMWPPRPAGHSRPGSPAARC